MAWPLELGSIHATSGRLLVWGGVGAVVVVAIRLLGRIPVSLAQGTSGPGLALLQLKSVADVFMVSLAGALLGLGLGTMLVGRRHRLGATVGAVVALVAVSAGLESLAGWIAGNQSPHPWPGWSYTVVAGLGWVGFITVCSLLGWLIVAKVVGRALAGDGHLAGDTTSQPVPVAVG